MKTDRKYQENSIGSLSVVQAMGRKAVRSSSLLYLTPTPLPLFPSPDDERGRGVPEIRVR
jgi:hypothetical protein